MRTAPVLFFLATLAGCASVDDSKKTITLDTATGQYERAIRWGEFKAADGLRRGSSGAEMDAGNLKAIRVTSYETLGVQKSADRSEATIDVKIKYYNEYTLREVSIIDHQNWVYDPAKKSWYITSPLPAFK